MNEINENDYMTDAKGRLIPKAISARKQRNANKKRRGKSF